MKDLAKEAFNKLMNELLGSGTKKANENLLSYLRLYSHVLNASARLNPHYHKKAFYYLRIIEQITREISIYEDEELLTYVHQIAESLISDEKAIVEGLKKGEKDPSSVRTRLLMIENLCVLRILGEARN